MTTPPQIAAYLASSFASPGGVTAPSNPAIQTQPPQQPVPVQTPPPQQNPQPKESMFGKLFNRLAGQNTSYTIDPSTGQTVEQTSQEKPSQMFGRILAAGLLASSGIGEQSGAHTFTQGLLQGTGRGVGERMSLAQQEDQKARAEAQQNYLNELKAKQEQREQTESQSRLDLDKASIAAHNAELAAQQFHLGQMQHEDQEKIAGLAVNAGAPMAQGYKDLNIEAVPGLTNVSDSDLHKYLDNNHDDVTKYVVLPTGTHAVQGADGKVSIENVYSAFPKMPSVPASLVSEMESQGWNKPDSQYSTVYKNLKQAYDNKQPVDFVKLRTAFSNLKNWEQIQAATTDQQIKKAELYKYQTEAADASMRRNHEAYQFKKEEDFDNGQHLFNANFDPNTGTLGSLNVGALKGNDKADLINYLSGLNQSLGQQILAKDKGTRDENGNVVYTEPEAISLFNYQNKVKGALSQVQTGTASPLNPGLPGAGVQPVSDKDIPSGYQIIRNPTTGQTLMSPSGKDGKPTGPFTPVVLNSSLLAEQDSVRDNLANLTDSEILLVGPSGDSKTVHKDEVSDFLAQNPLYSIVGSGQKASQPNNYQGR